MTENQGNNGPPPSRRGKPGPKTEKGKKRSALNSRRHGLYSAVSAVPAIAKCPLKDSSTCECEKGDLLGPCPKFLALEQALTTQFLKVPHIRRNVAVWPLVRELSKNLVALEVADAFVWRIGWVRAHQGSLDTHPLEVRRSTRAAETRRLFEVLGISPVSMRALRVPGPEAIDLASLLAQVAKREEGREP